MTPSSVVTTQSPCDLCFLFIHGKTMVLFLAWFRLRVSRVTWAGVRVKSPFAERKGVLSWSGNSPAFDRGPACAGCPDKETPWASTPATLNWNLLLNHARNSMQRGFMPRAVPENTHRQSLLEAALRHLPVRLFRMGIRNEDLEPFAIHPDFLAQRIEFSGSLKRRAYGIRGFIPPKQCDRE